MSNINWKVRLLNKKFWVTIIPAVLLLATQVAAIFGLKVDLGELGNQLVDIVGTVFLIFAIVGIINDPTTDGFKDSYRAMSYKKPN